VRRRLDCFRKGNAGRNRQQGCCAQRIDACASRSEDDRHVQSASGRREPCVTAAPAAGGLFVGDHDETFRIV
jgi:hypothetical protein